MDTVVSLPSSQQPANEFCSEQAELLPHSHFLPFLKTHTWFLYIFFGKEGKEENYAKKKQLLPH